MEERNIHYISTLSVFAVSSDQNIVIDEDYPLQLFHLPYLGGYGYICYFEKWISNVYIFSSSKFVAEKLVTEAIKRRLCTATVYRPGTITGICGIIFIESEIFLRT